MTETTETATKRKNRSPIAKLFTSPDEPRLRAGWRFIIQIALVPLLVLPFQLALIAAFQFIIFPFTGEIAFFLNTFLSFFSITMSVFLARRYLDQRSIASLGLKLNLKTVEDLLAGFVIPALMVGVIFFLERVFSWTMIDTVAWARYPLSVILQNVLVTLVLFTLIGWQEELLFRGYYLQNLEESLNLGWAIGLSSVAFGLFHILSMNSSSPLQLILGVIGTVLFSLLLVYAYLQTRSLWLPIGLHIGWNFFEGSIYGFPVSGIQFGGIVFHQAVGPEFITGGPYGPEGGLILLPALLVGFGLVYYFTKDRDLESADMQADEQESLELETLDSVDMATEITDIEAADDFQMAEGPILNPDIIEEQDEDNASENPNQENVIS